MNSGIDYGLGRTNIDTETGIRYGVIPANDVLQSWADSSEADYGEPTCPNCGDTIDMESEDTHCGTCNEHIGDASDCFGDEPIAWILDDGEYLAEQSGDDCDIFVLKSPYYTRAQFCSPCAPGAAYLTNPCDDGPRAYCFGADWFDSDNPCPYPVYRVDEIDPVTGDDPAPRYTPAIETDDIAE